MDLNGSNWIKLVQMAEIWLEIVVKRQFVGLLFFWTHFMYIKKGFIYSKMPFHKFSTSETLNDDSIHKKKNSHTVVQLYDRKNLIPYSNIEHKLEDI